MMKILATAALITTALGVGTGVHSELKFDAVAAKARPVTKVINLLKDMLKQLEKEAEEDEAIYDKMACWCEVNEKDKTKAIKDAEARIAQLQVQIEEDTAISARLNTEIKLTETEVAENQEALAEAVAIRKKELADFNEEEKESLEAIQALRAAVTVLSKHHGGASFLQVHTSVRGVAATLQRLVGSERMKGVLTHKERRAVAAFIQEPQDFFDAAPTMADQSYTPQSGEIFGILTQMKEIFEKDLSEAQKTEEARVKAFEEVKKAKEEEITAGQAQIEKKTEELADTDERLAHAKEDLVDTKASLGADEEFLDTLKQKCQMTDQEWEQRQKTRTAEMEAVSKAVAILSGDDAHDVFTRTFNPAFLQMGSRSGDRERASKLLSTKARELHSSRLLALAARVRLDAFTKVKEAIDALVKALEDEQAAEVKKRDWCTDDFDENAKQQQQTEFAKKDVVNKISSLKATIKTLESEITELKSEIAEMEKQLKAASEARSEENKDFQQTIADQQETQKLLKQALVVLQGFYGKGTTELVQRARQGPPAPPGFEEYKKSAAGGGVMEMIEQIIISAKTEEEEATRDEAEAQKAYEDFTKETKDSVAAKGSEIVAKSEDKAKAEEALVKAKDERENVLLELEELANYKTELHQTCDFVMKNFELRQTARSDEMEALRQAKAILSGSSFSA